MVCYGTFWSGQFLFHRQNFLRAGLHEGGGPQIGEVTPLGGVKIYMQSYNPAIPGSTFSRLLNGS